ncbi:hypothetical protein [Spirosoma pomorum]
MEDELSSLAAYSIVELVKDKDFSFTTANGIEYLVYFTEADGYAPSASFASELKMFGFTPIKETRPAGRLPKDDLVSQTVFEVIYYYFSQHPETVLVYVCDESSVWDPDNVKKPVFAKKRHAAFTEWFNRWQLTGVMPAVKIDYVYYDQLYCSCLFREGNSNEEEIREVIRQTILQKEQ